MSIFQGICTALVTPFDNDGKISIDKLRSNINNQIDNCVNALLILGTTGEPSTLSYDEQELCIDTTVSHVNHTVPVIVGVSSNDTAKCVQLAIAAQSKGADALLVCTPYYNKCTQQGLIAHYTTIANSVNLPIIMDNVPKRTGVDMQVDTVVKLSELNNIVAIKEASGDLDKIATIVQRTSADFDVYGGDDILAVPTMAMGAKGIISVVSNALPKEMMELASSCIYQYYDKARTLQLNMLELLHTMYSEVNPIGIKALLHIMGIDSGVLRLPLTQMSQDNYDNLSQEWQKYSKLHH